MNAINQNLLTDYLANDVVTNWLDKFSQSEDENLVCQRWLRQTPAKRLIFSELYGTLLDSKNRLRVLDVGGGLTAMTKVMASVHDYVLADLLAHDDLATARRLNEQVGKDFIRAQDWATLDAASYDLIIANDIFPNVDQRLEMFLDRFLPMTRRLRLSLTWYETPRYYMTRRIDADEIFCMLAWNGEHLASILKKFADRIEGADFQIFTNTSQSVYPNGRQVCLVDLRGDLAEATI